MKSEMTRSSASPNGDRAADDADREEDISAGDFRLHWHVYEYVYNPSAAAKREARCRICLFLVILCVLVVTVLVPRLKERTNGNVVRRARAPAPAGPAAGASRNTDDDKASASRTATDTRPTAKPPNPVKDITADGDAFRFLCGGQPVRTPKQNEEYRFFALPFDGAAATSAAWDTCWAHLSSAFPFLDWNYFDGIFDTTPADRSAFENMDGIVRNNNGVVHWYPFQPSSSPTSTKRQRRAPVDEDRKQQLFRHFSQFDAGAAFLILVDPKTERVVWQATWQHSARGAHPFRTAFINKIQSATKQQQQDQEQIDLRSGDLLCSAGVLQAMTSMQRLYNSEHSAIYLEQVFPAAVAEQRFFRAKNAKGQAVGAQEDIFDETHFLRKVIIADGSWATLPYSEGDAEPTATDVAAQRWLAGPGRVPPASLAPRPGVLQNTLWRYTKDEPQHLYLIDNYVPVDDIGIEVQEVVGGSATKSASIIPTTSGREAGGASPHTDAAVSGAHFQPLKNHPQPIEAVGKTAECACYQSPWLSGTFAEPALLLSSFVPGQVRLRTGTEPPPLPSGTYEGGRITDPGLTVSKDAANSQSQQKSRTPPSSPPQQINKKPAGETEINGQKEIVSDELIIQDWRFTYIYDIPAVGPTTSPAPKPLRLPAIPRVEWVTHDITPLAEQQRKARGMQAKQVADRAAAAEKRIRDDEIANEIRRSNFAAHEHEFLTDRSAGPDSTQIWKPAADAYARDKQAIHDFVDKATWEQLQQKVLQPDLHVDISEGAGIGRSASASAAREGLFTEGGGSGKVG
mmetsp:Transcript_14234/g.35310  ORF Transcript_14234/g.35310 Transcript_14234/m.35310 type:complete len:798 (-) Transcript_14234:95-2488(-)